MTTSGTEARLDLAPAADQLRQLAAGTTPDHMARPTPCADWNVRDLLRHILELAVAFRAGADKQDVDPDDVAARIDEAGQWRDDLSDRLDRLVAAWRRPDAWEGQTTVGGVTMPADMTAIVATDELVLHGWDLARATGQPFRCDDASLDAVMAFTAMMSDPEQRAGVFGAPVDVPPDATELERAVARSGRDPAWAR